MDWLPILIIVAVIVVIVAFSRRAEGLRQEREWAKKEAESEPTLSLRIKPPTRRSMSIGLSLERGSDASSWRRFLPVRGSLKDIKALTDWVVCDIEATGLGDRAELLEACVVDQGGKLVFDEIVNPESPIQKKASDKHGLTRAKVRNKPKFAEVYNRLYEALNGKTVVAYNADYDRRLVEQTCERYDLPAPDSVWVCAMLAYAELIGEPAKKRPGEYRWWKLAEALAGEKIINDMPHRARGDAEATRKLVLAMQREA